MDTFMVLLSISLILYVIFVCKKIDTFKTEKQEIEKDESNLVEKNKEKDESNLVEKNKNIRQSAIERSHNLDKLVIKNTPAIDRMEITKQKEILARPFVRRTLSKSMKKIGMTKSQQIAMSSSMSERKETHLTQKNPNSMSQYKELNYYLPEKGTVQGRANPFETGAFAQKIKWERRQQTNK